MSIGTNHITTGRDDVIARRFMLCLRASRVALFAAAAAFSISVGSSMIAPQALAQAADPGSSLFSGSNGDGSEAGDSNDDSGGSDAGNHDSDAGDRDSGDHDGGDHDGGDHGGGDHDGGDHGGGDHGGGGDHDGGGDD